jgi:hypothetical protein
MLVIPSGTKNCPPNPDKNEGVDQYCFGRSHCDAEALPTSQESQAEIEAIHSGKPKSQTAI